MTRHNPWCIDTEQRALGAALRSGAYLDALTADLTAASFYDPYHGRIWDALLALQSAGSASIASLAHRLRDDPGWAETGGLDYLEAMRSECPQNPPLKDYCAILTDYQSRRALLALGHDLVEVGQTSPHDISTPMATAEAAQRILALGASYQRERTQSLSGVARSRLDKAEQKRAGEGASSISTGLKRLDRAIGGLQPGDHMLCAGRSGGGKSALAASIGRAAAQAGHPVFIVCADMTKERWAERVMADVAFMANHADPIHYGWFRGVLAESQLERLAVAQNEMASWACDICDEGNISLTRIRAKVWAMANQHKGSQGLLIVDFLQKIRDENTRRDSRRDEEVTAVAYEIGDIVKDVGWSALSLAQLKNKDTDGRGKLNEAPPNETDIRESGGIQMAVDIAFAIHRKAYFVERREPPGRDTYPDPPPEWHDWKCELDSCKDEAQLIGFKNRDSSVTALHMTLWASMATNSFLDEKPGRGAYP